MTDGSPRRRRRVAWASHRFVNRHSDVSSRAAGVAASSPNAPPASTAESWWWSPTSSSFAPASRAWPASASRVKVPAREASSTMTSIPARIAHTGGCAWSWASRATWARRAATRSPRERASTSRAASDARRCALRPVAGSVVSCSHLAVFSHGIPNAADSSWAAAADGARPRTLRVPCSTSHTVRSAARVVVFPVPAGPTSTSMRRRLVAIATTASDWSAANRTSRAPACRGGCGAAATDAASRASADGAVRSSSASSRRASASRTSGWV